MLNLSINEQKQILGGYWQIKYFNKYGHCIRCTGYYSTEDDAAQAAEEAFRTGTAPTGAISYTTIER